MEPPYSCLATVLVDYPTVPIYDQAQLDAAAEAFINATGYQPFDWQAAFSILDQQAQDLFYINSIAFFTPFVILISLFLFIFQEANKIRWEIRLFFYVLAAFILYGAARIYLIAAKNSYLKDYDVLRNLAIAEQDAYYNSIALWINGLAATACAIVATPTTTDSQNTERPVNLPRGRSWQPNTISDGVPRKIFNR